MIPEGIPSFATSLSSQRKEFMSTHILLWLLITTPFQQATRQDGQGQTTCSVPPAHIGEESQLTCYFPEDLSQTKRDFGVLFYSDQRNRDVVDCVWEKDQMFCRNSEGYYDRERASDRFYVKLPSVSLNQAGIYRCWMDQDVKQSAACSLVIKQGPCTTELIVSTMTLNGNCIFEDTSKLRGVNKCSWYLSLGQLQYVASTVITSLKSDSGFKPACSLSYPVPKNRSGVYIFTVMLDNRVQYDTNDIFIDQPEGLATDCPPYVPEGTNVSCRCSLTSSGFPPALASWDRYKHVSILNVNDARRQGNSSVLGTCYFLWPSEVTEALQEILVQLAYGPYNESLSIDGPRTFVTDGSLWVTFTCTAADVNPAPLITWAGVTCRNHSAVTSNSRCTFMPKPAEDEQTVVRCTAVNSLNRHQLAMVSATIDLAYPPMTLPFIDGIRTGYVLHVGQSLNLTCTVEGGMPKVSFVNFTCGHRLGITGIVTNHSMSSSVTFDPLTADDDGTNCFCTAVWSPQPSLYLHIKSVTLNVSNYDNNEAGESLLIILGSGLASLVFVIISVSIIGSIICYFKGRRIYDHPKRSEEQDTERYRSLSPQFPATAAEETENGIYEEVQLSQESSLKSEDYQHLQRSTDSGSRTPHNPSPRLVSDYLHPVQDTAV